jgi:carboxyl-terminal processing protease
VVQTVFPFPADRIAVALTVAKYYTPSGRSIQRDYSNLEDYLMIREKAPEQREVRYTLKGRKVLGQGGITPDYEVKTTNKPLTLELFAKGSFFGYARKFAAHQTPLSQTFVFPGEAPTSSGILLTKTIKVDGRVLEDFKAFLQTNKISYTAAGFPEASSEIKRELEREITSALWGPEEGQRVYRLSDPVVLKALAVMPEAAKLIADRKGP